jgi:beta-glucosidase
MSRQMGGWTVTWQGDEISNSDFRTGETLLDALREELGPVHVTYAERDAVPQASEFDVVIAVVGEAAYAEYKGDVAYPAPLSFSALYPDQMDMVTEAAGLGIPVVTVVYSGRNLYATDLLNASDAFVAAYLPGSEAGGLVDLLVEPKPGSSQFDFSGHLPFAWPSDPCDSRAERSLFPRGYGLTYVAARELGKLKAPTPVESCDSP